MEADAGCVPGHGVRRGRDDRGVAKRREQKATGSEMLQVRLRILRAMGTPCPSGPGTAKHAAWLILMTGIISFLVSQIPMYRGLNLHAIHKNRDDGKSCPYPPFMVCLGPFG